MQNCFEYDVVIATQVVTAGGNSRSHDQYEQQVPLCYRRPHVSDPL